MKKEVKNGWEQELARDTLAIGGLVFYFLFIVRALIAPYYNYVIQLSIGLIALYILTTAVKNVQMHIARISIAAYFTIIFYNTDTFTILASIIYIAILTSAIYLKKDRIAIIKGIILGAISTVIAHWATICIMTGA